MNEASIFTRIINSEIPSHKIYEDDKVIAFLDINPITPGHTLVVPKQQIESLWDLDDEMYQYVMKIVNLVAKRQKEVLQPNRVGFFLDGVGVPHAHVHVLPLEGGLESAIANHFKKGQSEPDHTALAEMAGKLRL
jgi:histidine triad (HIT) family protein